MKKVIGIVLAAVLALSFVACSGGSIKDGTYTAEMKNASHGWRDTLSVTYKGGVIESAMYDAVKDDGTKKSSLTDEEYGMLAPDFVPISEWMPMLNENVKKAGTADKIEAVAGATSSSNAAKQLMVEVEKKAKAGDTTAAMIDNKVEG